ncbi:FTR1 family iron permease [Spongiibacter nanhainus]|uniref:FTR1 family iron permease n=1 Tax=Spongiibacter nanhainus TaxID=2794344 RepID=UPI001E4F65C5|nr:FTR1 family protein [Spongiibacter nanhainus]
MVENSLDAQDKALRQTLEADMMAIRQLLKQAQSPGEVESAVSRTLARLDDADRLLSESTLSNATLFSASLVILLREGLEALLVVIALVTVLVRTGRRDGLRYVHLGWVTALVAGVATWAAAQSLVSISGASREVMEGVAALLAAVVLLYVGIWMHSKTHAAQWQAYIQQHINSHLTAGTLWGLALLAFIAVYREVFETVLFYQALLTQAAAAQYSSVFSGFVAGTAFLAVLAWVLVRYSVKLPIARFFSVTTYLLLALAFILMGKAMSALQEADLIGITPLPVSFEFDWVGVKSTWQGILAQLSVLVVFLVFLGLARRQRKNAPVAERSGEFLEPGVTRSKPE